MNLEPKDGRSIANLLRELGESEALVISMRLLSDPTTRPSPNHAITRTVRAGALLEVWDARVRFAESKGRDFPGAKTLVERLATLDPATELVLHYLESLETVGLFYFEAKSESDKFVGLVLADRRAPITDSLTGD
jgi:hypothetical protein